MLIQTVRSLERNGLIERKVYPVVPPHVEYRRTELGQSLDFLLDGLCRWAENNMPAVSEARARFDEASETPGPSSALGDRPANASSEVIALTLGPPD